MRTQTIATTAHCSSGGVSRGVNITTHKHTHGQLVSTFVDLFIAVLLRTAEIFWRHPPNERFLNFFISSPATRGIPVVAIAAATTVPPRCIFVRPQGNAVAAGAVRYASPVFSFVRAIYRYIVVFLVPYTIFE